jgi:molecular chaperone DnaK (HSP70)
MDVNKVVHEIERKLCSLCCDRLDDLPKDKPCDDCTVPDYFDDEQRAAVASVLREFV